MKKRLVVTLFIVFGIALSFSQSSLNDYKYVIVPNKFDFLKEENQYQLNALTQFLFNKYGFVAIMEDEIFPEELANNRCLGLYPDVIKGKSLLRVKLSVSLKNCNNEIVYTTKEGVTKEKEFSKAYNFALRDAFKSFETINYSYTPNEKILAQAIPNKAQDNKQEIEALKKEVEDLKKQKEQLNKTVVVSKPKEEVKPKIVEKKVLEDAPVEVKADSNILYAQPKGNGYQLVDSTPKVVMLLLKTPKENTFLVKGKNAIVYLENNLWYLAKEANGQVTVEVLPVKF